MQKKYYGKVIKILNFLAKLLPEQIAYAHCDIPCGIYDPHVAQMAAHTVIRMVAIINDLKASSKNPSFDERKKIISQIARLTRVKEEHAELVKHEVRIIWGDYFKEENMKDAPNLHEKVFNIMKIASSAKQKISLEVANELLVAVQDFSEIFYKSKGLKPVRISSGYPTGGEIVSHK